MHSEPEVETERKPFERLPDGRRCARRSVSGAAPAAVPESSRAASRSHSGCRPPAAASGRATDASTRDRRELADQPDGLGSVQTGDHQRLEPGIDEGRR